MQGPLRHLDEGEFTEGHELDRKWQVPKAMVGRRLSQGEAKRLLAKFGYSTTAPHMGGRNSAAIPVRRAFFIVQTLT